MKGILKNYLKKFRKNYQAEYLAARELAYFKNCQKILDLGCGEGDFIAFDKKRIIGLDANKKNIAVCKEKGFKAVLGFVTKIPFTDENFDGIHASHIIEHLFPEEAHKMLFEAGRVLKKNGVFVLSTPILWQGFYNDLSHIRPYNPESILRYLCHSGAVKTFQDLQFRFELVDFYWRFRPVLTFGKIGYFLGNWLYQFGIHGLTKDAYTLVLKKVG